MVEENTAVIFSKEFEDIVKQHIENTYESASFIKKLNFYTEIGDKISLNTKKYMMKNVNRVFMIDKINKLINDIEAAIEIEAGAFEFSMVFASIRNLLEIMIPSIYNDKLNEILEYLDNKSMVYNPQLVKKIKNREIKLQKIAFLSPQDINPDNWEEIKKKRELREYKKNNMAATDLYKCFKCGESRCQVRQMQTRSADEPITNFVTCLNCYHTFKM